MNYGEHPPLAHTRIVLGHITGSEHLIQTPDGDRYTELLEPGNPDLTEFHVGPDDGSLPADLPAGIQIYGFGALTMQQFNAMLAEGRVETLAGAWAQGPSSSCCSRCRG